jgi:hypothetical protein
MILKLFIVMVIITVYPQCNSNTLKVIATDMLQSFKIFIIIVVGCHTPKFKILQCD